MTYTLMRWAHGLLKEGATVFLVTEEDTPLAVSQCLCGTEESATGTSAVLCSAACRKLGAPGHSHRRAPGRATETHQTAIVLRKKSLSCVGIPLLAFLVTISHSHCHCHRGYWLLLVCYLAKCLNLLLLITSDFWSAQRMLQRHRPDRVACSVVPWLPLACQTHSVVVVVGNLILFAFQP
jgi:hypothetical protein